MGTTVADHCQCFAVGAKRGVECFGRHICWQVLNGLMLVERRIQHCEGSVNYYQEPSIWTVLYKANLRCMLMDLLEDSCLLNIEDP